MPEEAECSSYVGVLAVDRDIFVQLAFAPLGLITLQTLGGSLNLEPEKYLLQRRRLLKIHAAAAAAENRKKKTKNVQGARVRMQYLNKTPQGAESTSSIKKTR